jgi:hypothetical protein
MKKNIKKLLYLAVNFMSWIYRQFYYLKNFNKPKVLIFTDSRGFEISKISNRKAPFNSYLDYFVKNYRSQVFICPEKHTTFFDFFDKINRKDLSKFKHIISHVGVVDFSPRPISDINSILKLKKKKITNVFGVDFYKKLLASPHYETKYFGEKTCSIIHENNIPRIAEELNKLENLIWISCNPVINEWKGNYTRERPKNINIVNEKSKSILSNLLDKIKVIDFTDFSKDDVMKYTCDNIHLSPIGMSFLEQEIKNIL